MDKVSFKISEKIGAEINDLMSACVRKQKTNPNLIFQVGFYGRYR